LALLSYWFLIVLIFIPPLSYGPLMGIVKEGVVKIRAESDQGIFVGAGAVLRVDQTNPNAMLARTKWLIQWGAGGAPRTTHQQFG
jgi:hypothetical protein